MNSQVKTDIYNVNDNNSYVGFKDLVRQLCDDFICNFFPGYFGSTKDMRNGDFLECLNKALSYCVKDQNDLDKILDVVESKLPNAFENICNDVAAAYRGDPAAKNFDEIILCYPCFKAISLYRFAHELYVLDVPILPRTITEYAHILTGIDIHPGATIGKSFFIDHGTGVVIGETTIIGNNVTLYQNVTLGAKSFSHDDSGIVVKGKKRHPNIGNDVVVYAGATILGDINISDGSVISGNSWITESV